MGRWRILIGDRLIDLAFKYDPNLKSLSSNEHWQNLAKEAFHWVLGDEIDWEHAFFGGMQAIDGRLGDLVDVFWFGKKLTPARAESVLSLLDDIFHWSDNACLKDLRDKLKKLLTTVDEEGGVDIDKLLDVLLMESKDLPADIQKKLQILKDLRELKSSIENKKWDDALKATDRTTDEAARLAARRPEDLKDALQQFIDLLKALVPYFLIARHVQEAIEGLQSAADQWWAALEKGDKEAHERPWRRRGRRSRGLAMP